MVRIMFTDGIESEESEMEADDDGAVKKEYSDDDLEDVPQTAGKSSSLFA